VTDLINIANTTELADITEQSDLLDITVTQELIDVTEEPDLVGITQDITKVEVLENNEIVSVSLEVNNIEVLELGVGLAIVWLGSLATAPSTPNINDAYYNTLDKKSYIYSGGLWQILAQDGTSAAVEDQIVDGVTTKAPSQNAVFDALAGKQASGSYLEPTFETVSKNLKAYPFVLNYTLGVLTSVVYTIGVTTITKTLNYTGGVLTSIVLAGDGLPSGISLTKTLTYAGGNLTGVIYS
jgi:hypothetical protein